MGMLEEGLQRVMAIWSELLDAAQIGTGTTAETVDDTGLETAIAGSDSTSITNTEAGQFIKRQASFSGTKSASEAVTEVVWKNVADGEAGSRIVFPAVTWDDESNIRIETRWHVRGRR